MMLPPQDALTTHDVANQPGPPPPSNLWTADAALASHAGGADDGLLASYGAALGSAEMREAGRTAERYPPELVLFDRGGRRVDEVAFHPAWHDLMRLGLEAGYAAGPWTGGTHLTHAVQVYLATQVEPGHCCPMTMTYAAIPVVAQSRLADAWLPKLTARAYDPSVAPVGAKRAATLGMAMTEKQGGSDLRSNATRAAADGDAWRLTGHKWFCSAPMSDGFLTLAQGPGGLTCYLVPRWLEQGRNAIRLMRLKDKLGNRANASAEIEFAAARAHQLGKPGRGVATIIEMVHHTRLDTAMAPAGLMRAALVEAHHWTSHRTAFQRLLIDQPAMAALLADLMLDWEGAVALGLHVARAFDDPGRRPFARLAVALAKYLNNKLAVGVVAEAMETLGGMGYVADTSLPMLFRETPLNSIWEGSGNVIALDILRTVARDPQAMAQLDADLDGAAGGDARFEAALAWFRDRWRRAPEEAEARAFAERLATLLTAAVLIRQAPGAVAAGYVATRLGEGRGRIAGAATGLDIPALLGRLGPHGGP